MTGEFILTFGRKYFNCKRIGIDIKGYRSIGQVFQEVEKQFSRDCYLS